jgi:hypothetical protein
MTSASRLSVPVSPGRFVPANTSTSSSTQMANTSQISATAGARLATLMRV